jgi:hypothetical protein
MTYFRLKLTQESPWGIFQWEVFATISSASIRLDISQADESFFEDAKVTYNGNAAIASPNSSGRVSAKLDTSKLYEFVKSAYDMHIPLIGVSFDSGLDGTSYTLEFSTDGFGSTNLTWWSSYPKEWQPLFAWWEEFIEFLNDAIEKKAL